jgi:hypothetical protein
MHTAAVALLQWQDTKLPLAVAGYQTACARGFPAAVSGYQTASMSKGQPNLQQQQSKMYTCGALQALAGKNIYVIKKVI